MCIAPILVDNVIYFSDGLARDCQARQSGRRPAGCDLIAIVGVVIFTLVVVFCEFNPVSPAGLAKRTGFTRGVTNGSQVKI